MGKSEMLSEETVWDDVSAAAICKTNLRAISSLDTVASKDDVVMEILLWLPAKSLTRFKSVSKHWSSLITTHHFSNLHTLRHRKPQPSLLLCTCWSNEFFYFHPTSLHAERKLKPYSFAIPDAKIVSSCNGLLLLESGDSRKEYYVCNPTTRQSRKICLIDDSKFTDVASINLAFDPSNSPHYKIVCIKATAYSYPLGGVPFYRIELYDSKNQSWKLCSTLFNEGIYLKFSRGVHWNNVIYWVNDGHSNHRYYDINNDIFGTLTLAQVPWHENMNIGGGHLFHRWQLLQSNGCLYYFLTVWNGVQHMFIAAYEVQSDNRGRWLIRYRDGLSRLCAGPYSILSFIRGDGEQGSEVVAHVPGKIVSYTLFDKSFKELVNFKNEHFYEEKFIQFDDRSVVLFGETLANV